MESLNLDKEMNSASQFGQAIKYLREKDNLTIEELAKKISVDPHVISRIENEGAQYVTSSVTKLCDYFRINYPKIKRRKKGKTTDMMPIIDISEIGPLLRKARRNIDKSIGFIAKEVNMAKSTVYDIEIGRSTNIDYILTLSKYYGIEMDIFGVDDNYKNNAEINQQGSPTSSPAKAIKDSNKSYENLGDQNKEIETPSNLSYIHSAPAPKESSMNREQEKIDLESLFYKKLLVSSPYTQVIKSMAVSYGIVFNYIGFSSDGKVHLYLPVDISNSIDFSCIKKIKSEYLIFIEEFSKFKQEPDKLEFTVCLLGGTKAKYIEFKEILYNLFNDYTYLNVQSFTTEELQDAADEYCLLETS